MIGNPDDPGSSITRVLEEFRRALASELDAVRSQAVGDIELVDGRRISSSNTNRYSFVVVGNARSLQAGSEALLAVDGDSLSVEIIDQRGQQVDLTCDEDLGAVVVRAHLRPDPSFLILSLLRRLEILETRPNRLGSLILGRGQPTGTPLSVPRSELNSEQHEAVESALGRELTVIWGPPGTGKTRTIGEIAAHAARGGERVLLVSHTNVALDEALLRAADQLEGELGPRGVLRVGVPRDKRLLERPTYLASHHVNEALHDFEAGRAEVTKQLQMVRGDVERVTEVLSLLEWLDGVRHPQRDAERMLKQRIPALLQQANERREVARGCVSDETVAQARTLARDESTLREQLAKVTDLKDRAARSETTKGRNVARALVDKLADIEVELGRAVDARLSFEQQHSLTIDAVMEGARESEWWLASAGKAEREQRVAQRDLRRSLHALLDVPRAYGLVEVPESADEHRLYDLLIQAEASAREVSDGVDRARIAAQAQELQGRQEVLEDDLLSLERRRSEAEYTVLLGARLIGCTLTAAYLRGAVTRQEIDLLIIDETSIASIPAVWAAAALAKRLVVVGDFRQLPPVCLSDQDLALKWLGRDVFDTAGWRAAWENGHPPPYFIALREQRRMDPAISRIPNQLVYGNLLRDGPGTSDDAELAAWASDRLMQSKAVEVVDTGSLPAWVATPTERLRGSKANPASALTSLLVAQRSLRSNRPSHRASDPPRVLIVTPYRAQSEFIERAIVAAGLQHEVVAGTVHAFQGAEAPLVILDVALAPPHHRAGLFSALRSESTRRLINVAVSRARRRLVVVGSFAYLRARANRRSPLRSLVEHLGNMYDARRAVAMWKAAADEGLSGWTLLRRAELANAIDGANDRVVIFSPAISDGALSLVAPAMARAVARGVTVLVVTAPDRESSVPSAEGVLAMRLAGAMVMRKKALMEGLAIVDNDQGWITAGSPLAQEDDLPAAVLNGGSAMQGLVSLLAVDQLVRVLDEEGRHCSRCQTELELAEPDHRRTERYWRCPACADGATRGVSPSMRVR